MSRLVGILTFIQMLCVALPSSGTLKTESLEDMYQGSDIVFIGTLDDEFHTRNSKGIPFIAREFLIVEVLKLNPSFTVSVDDVLTLNFIATPEGDSGELSTPLFPIVVGREYLVFSYIADEFYVCPIVGGQAGLMLIGDEGLLYSSSGSMRMGLVDTSIPIRSDRPMGKESALTNSTLRGLVEIISTPGAGKEHALRPISSDNLNDTEWRETTVDPQYGIQFFKARYESSGQRDVLCAGGYWNIPCEVEVYYNNTWERDIYENALSRWNMHMEVFDPQPASGGYGINGTPEICGFLSDEDLIYWFELSWGSAIGRCLAIPYPGTNQIWDANVAFKSDEAWAADLDSLRNNDELISLPRVANHEFGHLWGYQILGCPEEDYEYYQLSVMHSWLPSVIEDGQGIHATDAAIYRENYRDQVLVEDIVDMGIESYFPHPTHGLLLPGYIEECYLSTGDMLSVYGMIVENIGPYVVASVTVKFWLSDDTSIPADDYLLSEWVIQDFQSATWTDYQFDWEQEIPPGIPEGDYYLGVEVVPSGEPDVNTGNNRTTFKDLVWITSEPHPDCSVAPRYLEFAVTEIGEYEEKIVCIENTGDESITILVDEGCPDFDLPGGEYFEDLDPGEQTCRIVRYMPSDYGDDYCVIEVGSVCANIYAHGIGPQEPANYCPNLGQPYIYPDNGDTQSTYRFEVLYSDPEGDPPDWTRLVITDTVYNHWDMVPEDPNGDYTEGVFYQVEIPGSEIGIGNHQHVFIFSDYECGDNVRYPDTGHFAGPNIDSVEPYVFVTEPNSDGDYVDSSLPDPSFQIEWNTIDVDSDSLFCQIYWDDDNYYDNGGQTFIHEGWYAAGAGSYLWDMTGLVDGIYYIYMDVQDEYSMSDDDYSNGMIMLSDAGYCEDEWGGHSAPIPSNLAYVKLLTDGMGTYHMFGGEYDAHTILHTMSMDLQNWTPVEPAATGVYPDPHYDVCIRDSVIDLAYVKYLESYEVYHRRSVDFGITWGDEHAVTADDDNWSKFPAIAHASDGTLMIAWIDKLGAPGPSLHITYSDNGGVTWGGQHQLSNTGHEVSQYKDIPVFCADDDYTHLAWTHGNAELVEYRRRDVNGIWSANHVYPCGTDEVEKVDVSCFGENVDLVWENSYDNSVFHWHSADQGTSFGSATALTFDGLYSYPQVVRNNSGVYNFKLSSNDPRELSYTKSLDDGESWCYPLTNLGVSFGHWPNAVSTEDYIHVAIRRYDYDDVAIYSFPPFDAESILGDVMVDTCPDSLNASWTLTFPDASVSSGIGDSLFVGVQPGYYTIAWGEVPDWNAPEPLSQMLPPGTQIILEGRYYQDPGVVYVDATPDSIAAPWSLTGNVDPPFYLESSGDAELTEMLPGPYTLTWLPVVGWDITSANPDTLSLEPGDHVTFTGVYVTPFVDVTEGGLIDDHNGRAFVWADVDNDSLADLYIANFLNVNSLLHNDSLGIFSDITEAPLNDDGKGTSIAVGDYDNDGLIDFYLSNENEPNKLFHNLGEGVFEDTTSPALADEGSGEDVAFVDFDNDGLLDVYINNSNASKVLLKNEGAGIFSDVTPSVFQFSELVRDAAWVDYDQDGDMDVYICVVNGENQLFLNVGGGQFQNVSAPPINDENSGGGTCWGDYDNDLDFDFYLTVNNGLNRLFRNDDGVFTDVTSDDLADPNVGSGAAWADIDNDGDLDLYLVNENTENLLFRNLGGDAFENTGIMRDAGQGYTAAWADYDLDGDEDLYLVNYGVNKLFRNETPTENHWLHIDLEGTESNRSAIGAIVTCYTEEFAQIRQVGVGAGYESYSSLTVEFGLGIHTVVDSLVIRWPSGIVQDTMAVAADQRIRIEERDPTSIDEAQISSFALRHCFPNPFNPTTQIQFDLPAKSTVMLQIYNIAGRRVRKLLAEVEFDTGRHNVVWDGCDDSGQRLSSGVYFYQLRTKDFNETRKMILLK